MESSVNSRQNGKIKAYAILAGGGVKGAALVGGLAAAEKYGIEFVGYGGASAGSLIALLASLGYSTKEMKSIVLETDFCQFLDDKTGRQLSRIRQIGLRRFLLQSWCAPRDGILLNRIRRNLGLYKGHNLENYLMGKIVEKYPEFTDQERC
jgi:NTE family protein